MQVCVVPGGSASDTHAHPDREKQPKVTARPGSWSPRQEPARETESTLYPSVLKKASNCKQTGQGVPGGRTRHGFLDVRSHFWRDLNLDTVRVILLASEQVSAVNDLNGGGEHRNKGKAVKKQ